MTTNPGGLGIDHASEPRRRAAITVARDLGVSSMTPPVQLRDAGNRSSD